MTPLGWVAAALAVALLGAPVTAPGRLAALASTGRVVVRVRGRSAAWRRLTRRTAGALQPGGGGAGVRRGAGLVITALAATAGGVCGPPIAVAAGALAATVWRLAADVADRRGESRASGQLLGAVRVLVAELSAGSRPGAALRAAEGVAPVHEAIFAAAAHAADAGDDAGAPLRAAPGTLALGVAWALGRDSGAALAPVLQRVAADLAAVAEQRRAVAVALAGPRSSAVVLAGLPAVGIAMGSAMGARPVAFLLATAAGRLLCAAGVLLDVAGVLWVRRIIRRAERTE